MPIRVAVIDDDDYIHQTVKDLLRATRDMILVGQAFRGDDAMTLCQTSKPDILLMDVRMPGIGGIEATRQVLEAYPEIKILALSSYQDYEIIKAMLDNGADGYLVKGSEADDLLDTIRLVYQGKSVLTPEVMDTLLSHTFAPPAENPLTKRELEVLTLMADGLNNREVAEKLDISIRTIRFHITNMSKKLGVKTRSEALIVAAKQNLI